MNGIVYIQAGVETHQVNSTLSRPEAIIAFVNYHGLLSNRSPAGKDSLHGLSVNTRPKSTFTHRSETATAFHITGLSPFPASRLKFESARGDMRDLTES